MGLMGGINGVVWGFNGVMGLNRCLMDIHDVIKMWVVNGVKYLLNGG